MQTFWLKGCQFQAEVLFWPNILEVITHYVCVAYCYISLFFLMAPSECFDLRKKKEANQWNKPRILLSLRGKSVLHRLRVFGFKHLLEAFAWRLHEKPVALSQPLVWIPSWEAQSELFGSAINAGVNTVLRLYASDDLNRWWFLGLRYHSLHWAVHSTSRHFLIK